MISFAQSGKSIDSTGSNPQIDTLARKPYINKGKIAAQKAINRSLILPGLGQLYNYGLVVDDIKSGQVQGKRIGQKIYQIGKVAAIYTGGTMLVMSYFDNNNNYHRFLRELQYRKLHNGSPDPDNGLTKYPDVNALTLAKNIYKRNREVVIFSLLGLYGLNVLDAYVTARLKYFNVDERLTLKISPSTINTNTMYGSYQIAPALKISINL